MSRKENNERRTGLARSVARLNALQALYQIEFLDSKAADVVTEFSKFRIGVEIDGDSFANTDFNHFNWLVITVTHEKDRLDDYISEVLNPDWKVDRLGYLKLSLLRAALIELKDRLDIPARVIIDEYIDLARAFFSKSEAAFVNAALDKLARQFRRTEIGLTDEVGHNVKTSSRI